jgi:hypothetical protein
MRRMMHVSLANMKYVFWKTGERCGLGKARAGEISRGNKR